VVPGTSSRGERGHSKRAEVAFGHGRDPDRAPLPRRPADLPPLDPSFWHVLDGGLSALGLELGDPIRSAIDGHVRLLLTWNEHINLTALRAPEQIARGHLLDSLSAVPLLRRLAAAGAGRRKGRLPRLLDLGSGAGFPGLPLALVLPAERGVLVDSIAKKAAFLEAAGAAAAKALREAGEQPPLLEAIADRAEDLARQPAHRAAYDIVTARAVGSLAEVAELALPLLRMGGHVVAWKREDEAGSLKLEVNSARRVVQAVGGTPPRVESVDRGNRLGLADHRLVVVRKARPTPDRYPRAAAERRRAALP
jgi:16S rRNA (guanine527-N7)-methyltransferase